MIKIINSNLQKQHHSRNDSISFEKPNEQDVLISEAKTKSVLVKQDTYELEVE